MMLEWENIIPNHIVWRGIKQKAKKKKKKRKKKRTAQSMACHCKIPMLSAYVAHSMTDRWTDRQIPSCTPLPQGEVT